jgi:hypothetical protein
MDVEPIERINSSAIFGGLNQSIYVYQDCVVVSNPVLSVLDAEEVSYDQISEVSLYTGILYATLTLGLRSGYRVMMRWLPKGKSTRVAALIRERT